MHNFILFIKEIRIYKKKELREAFHSLPKKQLLTFYIFTIIAFVSTLIILSKINDSFMVEIPADGGTISEGIIGMPTLVNPVLALSDADKDLTSLVYSGLMRKQSDGTFIPDLAKDEPIISQDGKNYTFTIKDNAKFQDGSHVTADDIIFTIDKIKNPLIKSPRKTDWDGISVEKKDDKTVVFLLNQPYISFMDNTTIGILSASIWKNVNDTEFSISPLNIKAIGSGPYLIKSIDKNSDGIPVKYSLKRFRDFTLGSPHITYLNIISYSNEKDLLKDLLGHYIDQASGISPNNADNILKSKYIINTATLPRIFGLFFNSSKNKIFTDPQVTKALNIALDRQEMVDQILNGYGTIGYNPVIKSISSIDQDAKYNTSLISEANLILDKAGWVMGEDGIRTKGGAVTSSVTKKVGKKTVTQKVTTTTPSVRLSFSITTGDTPELQKAVSLIKDQLLKIGVDVDIQKIYVISQLNQIIRARDYEALFFGQFINHESNLYSFWHSSQKLDPGLNIAMYSNSKVDAILESLQKTLDRDDRANKYQELAKEFNNNIPALLVYSPEYLYVTSAKLKDINLDLITVPSDRFASVYTWHADTDHVWRIFN